MVFDATHSANVNMYYFLMNCGVNSVLLNRTHVTPISNVGCYTTKTCIESENDLLGPQGQSYARSQKKEGCVAKLLSAAITHTRPFNLHLDF